MNNRNILVMLTRIELSLKVGTKEREQCLGYHPKTFQEIKLCLSTKEVPKHYARHVDYYVAENSSAELHSNLKKTDKRDYSRI
jgi:hypothetical protein